MIHRHAFITSAALLFFAVWDAILAFVAIALPDVWFQIFHGVEPVDPQGLLTRTGAVWAAFSLFHFMAWQAWKTKPYWLVIVGGMRLSEIFADVAYVLSATDRTLIGTLGLLLATPTNIIFAVYFIRMYIVRTERAAAV
jgi:hypothetical protein